MKLHTITLSDTILLILLAASRIADVLTTYLVTPDLSREQNMITIYVFNRSWFVLIITQCVFTIGIMFLFILLKKKVQIIPITQKGMNISSFLSMQFFGDEHSYYKLLLHFPTQNKQLYWYLVTYWSIVTGVTAGFIVSIVNVIGPAGLHLFWFPPYRIYQIGYIGVSLCAGFFITKQHTQYLYHTFYASDQTA